MQISAASEADVVDASECLGLAFGDDPLIGFFFPGWDRTALAVEMFAILLAARIALGMPALLLRQDGQIVGAVMGYDTRSLDWLARLQDQWSRFEDKQSDMADRFAKMEVISQRFRPSAPHYYLGALGVLPSMQRRGGGAALV